VHSALLISRNPFPLHEFNPLQLLVAVLHELCPLHELAPIHLPFILPACAAIGAVASIAAAAIAMATPVVFFTLIMICKSSFICRTPKYYAKYSQKYHGFNCYLSAMDSKDSENSPRYLGPSITDSSQIRCQIGRRMPKSLMTGICCGGAGLACGLLISPTFKKLGWETIFGGLLAIKN
jgi:hypothetical protein